MTEKESTIKLSNAQFLIDGIQKTLSKMFQHNKKNMEKFEVVLEVILSKKVRFAENKFVLSDILLTRQRVL